MPKGPVPASFHDLLTSTAFAFVATLGRQGEPQVNPVWFLWDGEHILLSLIDGKQKYLNLQRDNRIAIAIAHPSDPYRYIEVRGHVAQIVPDHDDAVFKAISTKYTGYGYSLEPEGTKRYVATVVVERHTYPGAARVSLSVTVPGAACGTRNPRPASAGRGWLRWIGACPQDAAPARV